MDMNATMRNLLKVSLGFWFLLTVLWIESGLSQESFPNRPIRIIQASGAGMSDTILRVFCKEAEKEFGQSIVIETKSGGGGTIAFTYVLQSKPDGYTLGLTAPGPYFHTPHMRKTPYNPLTDFIDIIAVFKYNFGLCVRADAPWNTYEDVVAYAKKNPGKFTFTTPFVGGTQHICMERMAIKEGIKWTHVPYKSGAETVTAVLGGHNDAVIAGSVDLLPHIKAGKLKMLLALDDTRWPSVPNVPHMLEKGYDFYALSFITIYGPKGIPEVTVQKLEEVFKKSMNTSSFINVLKQFEVQPANMGGKEYSAFWRARYEQMGKVIKAMDLKE